MRTGLRSPLGAQAPSGVTTPCDAELAYIAGFLDADGCVNAQIVRRSDYALRFQIRPSITFYQKTKRYWILQDLHRILGRGVLRKKNNGMSEYTITQAQDVLYTLQLVSKYARVKQPQLKLLYQILHQRTKKNDVHQFLQKCVLVDRFADLNDRSALTPLGWCLINICANQPMNT